VRLTEDMRAVIGAQRLCFAATVTPDGKPNLSPKGTIRVWDDSHLFFCDIASPGTRANLARNPWIELNVVDGLSRRGYRFLGRATLHREDDVYREAVARITREEGAAYPVESIVLIAIERALPLVSPGYDHVPDERAMRAVWKERRATLDAEFERHVDREGPWSPRGRTR
jgi:predicted pyridoxine 5'-phosphate oxidase superfamily flavin-nucleotide-binding protein